MENPFLRIKKMNTLLKVIIFILFLGIGTTYYYTKSSVEDYFTDTIKEIDSLKETQELHDSEVKKLEQEILRKDKELKKLSLTKNIIKQYILTKNPDVNERMAEGYALKIVRESKKRGNSPYIQTALLASESSFYKNPKHDISTVVGMGGIYWNVWSKKLKQERIASSINDLRNPYTNIEASSMVLSYYMDCSKTPREALARYKGFCSLGKSQANQVMSVALTLKAKEKEYNV
jgi:hypothetical protein